MSKDQLQAAVDSMPWYHRIELPHGIVTPGFAPLYPEYYKLPADLTGKRVLDVGTYDGYWAFECMKRGAHGVVAIDDFSDTIHAGEKRSWAQFDLCRQALGYHPMDVEHYDISVYDVDECYDEDFDVVLFLGVLYHCRHPMLALDTLRKACKPDALLIVESHICDDYSPYQGRGHGEKMVCEFYPENQLANCATNWWAPTLKCLANMVAAAGFKDVRAWKIDNPEQLPYCRGFVQAIAA